MTDGATVRLVLSPAPGEDEDGRNIRTRLRRFETI
jgi:hypothetical protein